jgi:hypothetical protein
MSFMDPDLPDSVAERQLRTYEYLLKRPTIVGRGRLTWPRMERVGDRYGCVMLLDDRDEPDPLDGTLEDRYGKLIARVTSRGVSQHIGDLFRGLAPPRSIDEAPALDSEHVLGEGVVFYEVVDGCWCIGLEPEDGRGSDWLDPRVLYLLHEQQVELRFEPTR